MIVEFISDSNAAEPIPAKQNVPSWYKNSKRVFLDDDNVERDNLKKCTPFLDSMLSGYMILLPEDILVEIVDDKTIINHEFVYERHHKMGDDIPTPSGHETNKFAWINKWAWKTPAGWSTIVTHPYNRFDLPFTSVSAIVDSDTFVSGGLIPFYIKSGFNGIIEKGTPIAQIIPFQRQEWDSNISNNLDLITKKDGKYNDNNWSKKKYD